MLLLVFGVGESRFAMSCERVVEVVPLVKLTPIPRCASYLVGTLNYRGTPCPVVDLGLLLGGAPCQWRYHTRIMVVLYDGGKKIMGFLAERVTETVHWSPEDFKEESLEASALPFLKGWHYQGDESVQWIDVEALVEQTKSWARVEQEES